MAKKVQGTIVYMQSGALGAAKAVTGITKANPAVVTCPAHGFADGDLVVISGIAGMQEVNDRAFVISIPVTSPETTDTFQLKGVNSTNYTTFVSGGSPETGTASKATLTAIGEVTSNPDMGGTEPNPIDVSHLLSVARQELAGLPRQAPVSFNVWFDLSTAGHSELIVANQDLADRAFKFALPGSWQMGVLAQVGGMKVSGGGVDAAYSASVNLTPRGAGAWSTV